MIVTSSLRESQFQYSSGAANTKVTVGTEENVEIRSRINVPNVGVGVCVLASVLVVTDLFSLVDVVSSVSVSDCEIVESKGTLLQHWRNTAERRFRLSWWKLENWKRIYCVQQM